MPRGKAVDYAQPVTAPERSDEEYRQLAINTKLRTLADMTEREIRDLERHYGCPVIRPDRPRPRRARRPSLTVAPA